MELNFRGVTSILTSDEAICSEMDAEPKSERNFFKPEEKSSSLHSSRFTEDYSCVSHLSESKSVTEKKKGKKSTLVSR